MSCSSAPRVGGTFLRAAREIPHRLIDGTWFLRLLIFILYIYSNAYSGRIQLTGSAIAPLTDGQDELRRLLVN
jgi:hypothetical protein